MTGKKEKKKASEIPKEEKDKRESRNNKMELTIKQDKFNSITAKTELTAILCWFRPPSA